MNIIVLLLVIILFIFITAYFNEDTSRLIQKKRNRVLS